MYFDFSHCTLISCSFSYKREVCDQLTIYEHWDDIRRSNLYDDMISLFQSENVLNYYPLRISFVDERAIDCGGLCRDMISGFCE